MEKRQVRTVHGVPGLRNSSNVRFHAGVHACSGSQNSVHVEENGIELIRPHYHLRRLRGPIHQTSTITPHPHRCPCPAPPAQADRADPPGAPEATTSSNGTSSASTPQANHAVETLLGHQVDGVHAEHGGREVSRAVRTSLLHMTQNGGPRFHLTSGLGLQSRYHEFAHALKTIPARQSTTLHTMPSGAATPSATTITAKR